jgi:hypothetical protein
MSQHRKSEDRSISRRDFVRKSALGALTIPLFAQDYGLLFAQSAGKPVMTIASLNAFFKNAQDRGPAAFERTLTAALQNLEQFLMNNFTINPKQMELFRAAYSERRSPIDEVLKAGIIQARSRGIVAPLRFAFDPNVSPLVRISGFGREAGGCGNIAVGALKRTAQRTLATDCVAKNCDWVMNCVSGACR